MATKTLVEGPPGKFKTKYSNKRVKYVCYVSKREARKLTRYLSTPSSKQRDMVKDDTLHFAQISFHSIFTTKLHIKRTK